MPGRDPPLLLPVRRARETRPAVSLRGMSRLLALWLTLLASFWLTRAVSSALLFGHADRTYEGFFQLVTVPVIQALLVAWATRRPGRPAHLLPVRVALRRPDLRAILLFDAAVIALGTMLPGISWFSLAQGRNLPSAWVALKAIAAGAVLVQQAREPSERAPQWLQALAAALFGLGLAVFLDAIRPLPALLFPAQPRLLRWILVNGTVLAVGAALLMRVQRRLLRGRTAAALALDWTLGLALVAALISAVHVFRHPFLTEPWASLAASCNSLAVTAALLAALLSRDRPDLPPEAFANDENDSRSGEEAVK